MTAAQHRRSLGRTLLAIGIALGAGLSAGCGVSQFLPIQPQPKPVQMTELRPATGQVLLFLANATNRPIAFAVGNSLLPQSQRGQYVVAQHPAGAIIVTAQTTALLRNQVIADTSFTAAPDSRLFLVLSSPQGLLQNPLDAAPILTGGPDPVPFFASYRPNPAQLAEIQSGLSQID